MSLDIADIFLPCTQDDLYYWISLEHNQATISIGVISPLSTPGTPQEPPVDEKAQHLSMIEKVLASGTEALVKHTSLELVEEALSFLCTRPLSHLVEAPRFEVINKFAGDFDAIVQKVRASITAKDEYERRVKDSHSQLVTRSQQILEEIKQYNADTEASDQEMVEVREGLRKLEAEAVLFREKVLVSSRSPAPDECSFYFGQVRRSVQFKQR